jgi:hypothetical protein
MTPLTAGRRVEFDQVNKISLIRVEGRLTDESLADLDEASRKCSAATEARVAIVDLSSVSEFALSCDFIRRLAHRQPAKGEHLCFIIAPQELAFGLCRMFQIEGEVLRPLLRVVRTLGEAFAEIGIRSVYFEPSVVPTLFSGGYQAAVTA